MYTSLTLGTNLFEIKIKYYVFSLIWYDCDLMSLNLFWSNLHFGTNYWCLSDIGDRHFGSLSKKAVGYTLYLNGFWFVKDMQIILLSIYWYTFLILFLHSTQVREREKPYETIITCGQIQYINMADSSHHYDVIGYRKEQGQEGLS